MTPPLVVACKFGLFNMKKINKDVIREIRDRLDYESEHFIKLPKQKFNVILAKLS